MPLLRMLCSWGPTSVPVADRKSNTLYFNVSGSVDDPDYQALANDLVAIYAARGYTTGAKIEVRVYDMADAKPRPEKAFATTTRTGSTPPGAQQVALCLSYYADRNLPRNRGRIYTGYGIGSNSDYAPGVIMSDLLAFGQALGGLGGLNVDWSIYSPTTNTAKRINNIWVDNSWDIIRSRKLKSTGRLTATLNG